MITQIRDSILIRFIWGFLALHVLNISVDVADPNPNSVRENLSINDQESIVELIVEKVFGFKNAIIEYDDVDSDQKTEKKNAKIDFVYLTFLDSEEITRFETTQSLQFSNYLNQLTIGYRDLMDKPPKYDLT